MIKCKDNKYSYYVKDIGDLVQAIIVIAGLMVASVVSISAVSLVTQEKGEKAANCIANFDVSKDPLTPGDICDRVRDNGEDNVDNVDSGTTPPVNSTSPDVESKVQYCEARQGKTDYGDVTVSDDKSRHAVFRVIDSWQDSTGRTCYFEFEIIAYEEGKEVTRYICYGGCKEEIMEKVLRGEPHNGNILNISHIPDFDFDLINYYPEVGLEIKLDWTGTTDRLTTQV